MSYFSLPSDAGKPYIITVYPSEGWTTGGTKVCIVGMNFYEGIEVAYQQAVRYASREGKWEEKGEEREGGEGRTTQS